MVHPESEIAVILMALGAAYAGKRTAVGTSGGGFCLMTESLSLAGQAELPVAIVLGQRPGPSTGLPTYSCQTELLFARHAGQGEFPRLIVAPGDAGEAYVWAARVLDLAWRFQPPGFLLVDKTLCEGGYSCAFDPAAALVPPPEPPGDVPSTRTSAGSRESGVSPMLPVGTPGAVVKVNSHEHDEAGITIEDGATTVAMQEKRMRKGAALATALAEFETVAVRRRRRPRGRRLLGLDYRGRAARPRADLPVRVVQPVVLEPFPAEAFRKAGTGSTGSSWSRRI